MTLETPRLILQPFTLEDLADLVQLHADPEVNRYFNLREAWPKAFVEQKLKGFIADQKTLGYSKLKVTLKNGIFIGRAGFSLWEETGETELGYSFKREHWGKGYATEAAQALVHWIVATTELEYVIGFAAVEHVASRKVLEKIGMTLTTVRMKKEMPFAFYKLTREKVAALIL
jgi:[ribosomal protein S5]-alanine N-acetyltransferase